MTQKLDMKIKRFNVVTGWSEDNTPEYFLTYTRGNMELLAEPGHHYATLRDAVEAALEWSDSIESELIRRKEQLELSEGIDLSEDYEYQRVLEELAADPGFPEELDAAIRAELARDYEPIEPAIRRLLAISKPSD